MSWFDRWRRALTRSTPLTLGQVLGLDAPDSYAYVGETLTTDGALRLSAVWAAVRLLSDTISTLPLDAYRRGEQVALPSLLAKPAAGLDRTEWLYQLMVSLLLRGNGFGLITARSGAAMRPAQVELVSPDTMSVRVTPDGRLEYRRLGKELDPADVWHVRAFAYPGSPVGLSPIAYARHAIGLGLATQLFGEQFFTDGAHPSGLLSSEDDLNRESAKEAKQRFMDAHKGKREPAVLGHGMKYQPIQITPEESQFIATQQFTVTQIARIYGVPASMIDGETGATLTYTNSEARGIDLLRYSLSSWLVRLERAMERLLPVGISLKFNPNAILRATTTERFAAYKTAIDAGFMTVDEVRALEDLPALPASAAPRKLEGVA